MSAFGPTSKANFWDSGCKLILGRRRPRSMKRFFQIFFLIFEVTWALIGVLIGSAYWYDNESKLIPCWLMPG